VLQTYFVPNTLSRVVNKENDLHEIVFQSDNINLPFLFSKYSTSASSQLILNLVGKPKISSESQERHEVNRNLTEDLDQDVDGLQKLEITKDSFLEKQIESYMANHSISASGSRATCFP